MEVLADYGTVAYFGIATFTTGIFRTWYGLGDPAPPRSSPPCCSVSCSC
jgi:ABC-type Fe3+ transport system permease subunit